MANLPQLAIPTLALLFKTFRVARSLHLVNVYNSMVEEPRTTKFRKRKAAKPKLSERRVGFRPPESLSMQCVTADIPRRLSGSSLDSHSRLDRSTLECST